MENLTLKERVVNGLDEDEAWRLLHQLVDALVHMEGLGIVSSKVFRLKSCERLSLDPSVGHLSKVSSIRMKD